MTGSPYNRHANSVENYNLERVNRRLCDYCNDKIAVLYCRADSAKLCLSCDREVHSTNQLFSKHSRSQLCDVCDASPASIFCETEHSVLCSNCDWENHCQGTLSLSPVHNRRPIEWFTGCPSVNELLTIVGVDELDSKALFMSGENRNDDNGNCVGDDGGFSDLLFWESPDFVSIDDLIVTGDSGHNFQALDVPPLPKNRNAVCGQHKEEMLCQLRQLAKSEPNFDPTLGFQLVVPDQNLLLGNKRTCTEDFAEPISFPGNEADGLQWLTDGSEGTNEFASKLSRNYVEESCMVPDKQVDNDGHMTHVNDGYDGQLHVPLTTETSTFLPKVGHHVHELNSQERDCAISRYKEKRKTRRYEKHIRYESRKARAESRTRIRGRFAKVNH